MVFARAVLASVAVFGGAFGAAAEDALLCGRKADMVDIIIDMQGPTVESVWRDGKLFVNRDTADGSLWAFSLPNTTVHPSAVCRRTVGEGATARVEIGILCPAGEKACSSFQAQVLQRMDKIDAGTR